MEETCQVLKTWQVWGGKEVMTEKNLKLGVGTVRTSVPALA
jgi:hypothetical protein